MKMVVLRTVLGSRMKVLLNDKFYQKVCNISKRRYCEKKTVKELQGYRKTPIDGAAETSEHGYLALIFPFTTFLLGIWQVKRQKWKTDLKKFLNSRYEAEPVPLPENLETFDFSELEHRRIKIRGEFQYDKEFCLGPTTGPVPSTSNQFAITEHRAPGFHLITPFKLEGRNCTIMVNRGFLPEKLLMDKEARTKYQVHGIQELTGILRFDQDTRTAKFLLSGDINKPQRREDCFVFFMVRHLDTMARYCGSAPIYMESLTQSTAQFAPTVTAKAKVEIRDDHTIYAFIWFSLTFLTAWMWYSSMRPGRQFLNIHKTMEQQKNFKRNPRVK